MKKINSFFKGLVGFESKKKGFTLIEILVVIGIIAVLAAIVIVAINPARQFAQARNTQRTSNIEAILNAVGQRIADNKGIFETGCSAGAIPTSAKNIGSAAADYDIRDCLIPTYISSLPYDPTDGSACSPSESTCTTYDTGYEIKRDSSTGRITVSAPAALAASELSQTISLTR